MFNQITDKIRKSFSDSADQYDLQASLHREIGRELIAKIAKKLKVNAVLDVGCGTGYLTGKAKAYFSESKIVGLDFSQGMLEVAQGKHEGIDWVLGNAEELPFPDDEFDILISNLAYQWVEDLGKAWAEVRRVLSAQGTFVCTLFGYYTCDELFQSLNLAAEGQKLNFKRLPSVEQVKEALSKAGFINPKVDYERIEIEFKDMNDLAQWLKSIGANQLPREGYVGKDILSRASQIYKERFAYHHGIKASFEVIWVEAQKI